MGGKTLNRILTAWTAITVAFLYIPIALLIIYSFNTSRLNIVWTGFTFHWYRDALATRDLREGLINTIIVAVATTLLAVPLGTAGAWLLYRYRFPLLRLINTLVFIPMIMPEVIMGVSLMIFFVAVAQFGNQILSKLGNDNEPLGLGFATLIIGHVTFCFPFVMATVQARLAGMDPSLEEAAMDLGATPWNAFRLVLLPYLMPAVISGALMTFTLSMDELIVSYFTYGSNSITLPIRIFGMARVGLDPRLNALSTIFLVSTAIFVVAAEYIRKRSDASGKNN
jgi:spermidine/putrescine transport system permease protein